MHVERVFNSKLNTRSNVTQGEFLWCFCLAGFRGGGEGDVLGALDAALDGGLIHAQ